MFKHLWSNSFKEKGPTATGNRQKVQSGHHSYISPPCADFVFSLQLSLSSSSCIPRLPPLSSLCTGELYLIRTMAYCVLLSCPCPPPTSFTPSLPLFDMVFFSLLLTLLLFIVFPLLGGLVAEMEKMEERSNKEKGMSEGCRVLHETVKERKKRNWQIRKSRQKMERNVKQWEMKNSPLSVGERRTGHRVKAGTLEMEEEVCCCE